MHDLWPVSSICHYAEECTGFHNACGHCPQLPHPSSKDLSHQVWKQKEKVYRKGKITFVACSQWLATQARMASLSQGHRVVSIPNAIDTQVFRPMDRRAAREALGLPTDPNLKIVLFVAQQITNVRKGGPYLIEAFQKLLAAHPDYRHNTALLILGGAAEQYISSFDVPVFPVGYTEEVERIVQTYNAADLFVIPSVSDNLPNTIMEALACGLPCVGFAAGGIPNDRSSLQRLCGARTRHTRFGKWTALGASVGCHNAATSSPRQGAPLLLSTACGAAISRHLRGKIGYSQPPSQPSPKAGIQTLASYV